MKNAILFLVVFQLLNLASGQKGHPVYEFSTKLLNQVAFEKGAQGQSNVLISPFSIRTALAIIYLGARGQTAKEIRETLQLPVAEDELIQNLARQISTTSTSETSTFNFGNGLFLDKSFSANETLVNKLKSNLGTSVQGLDFKHDASGASSKINKWISSVTKGHIQNLVSPSSSPAPTFSFLLANALFYSGQWAKPFSVLPKKHGFKLDSGKEVKVTMMGLESTFGYSYIPELKSIGIAIPFKDDRFDFIILKPEDQQSVASVLPLLNAYPLDKLASKLEENLRTVTLTLPKFTLKANYDTINVLRKMGITSVFDPASSDLSALAKSKSEKAVISRMVHMTTLDINELGATGAAGTALSGYPISVASSLDINKPFIFLLNDRLTGPLLIGLMNNPLL